MVRIVAVEIFEVQTHAAARGESLKELLEKLCVHVTNFVSGEHHFPDEIGAIAEVEGCAAQGFVHRQIGVSIARDAAEIAKRFDEGFADNNARILHRMMHIDVEIALGSDMKINARMFGETFQHVIKEPDAGLNIARPRPIEVEGDCDVGFLGFAGDFRCAVFGHGAVILLKW